MNLLNKFLWLLVLVHTAGVFAQDLQIEPTFGDSWISRDQTIGLHLSRPLEPDDGKLAIFIGSTDMTDVFVQQNRDGSIPEDNLKYQGLFRLVGRSIKHLRRRTIVWAHLF